LRRERRNITGRASRGLLAALRRNGNVAAVSFSSRRHVDGAPTTYLTAYLSMKVAVMSAPLNPELARLLEGHATVAGKIRALAAAGYPRAEIGRILGKRYQHVRNVLEEPAKVEPGAVAGAPSGVAEADSSPFVHDRARTLRLEVRQDGSVVLPPEVLEALGSRSGGVIIADLDGETLTMVGAVTALRQIQAIVRKHVPPEVSLVDELIMDRRREAAAEEAED
jgi:bifunctional DNA-binding transcriptional regulator/antitoxin component of YhaV-PrlF toxin-antitoxin module